MSGHAVLLLGMAAFAFGWLVAIFQCNYRKIVDGKCPVCTKSFDSEARGP